MYFFSFNIISFVIINFVVSFESYLAVFTHIKLDLFYSLKKLRKLQQAMG